MDMWRQPDVALLCTLGVPGHLRLAVPFWTALNRGFDHRLSYIAPSKELLIQT